MHKHAHGHRSAEEKMVIQTMYTVILYMIQQLKTVQLVPSKKLFLVQLSSKCATVHESTDHPNSEILRDITIFRETH